MIAPFFPVNGINSAGETKPNEGDYHRTKASEPTIIPGVEYCG